MSNPTTGTRVYRLGMDHYAVRAGVVWIHLFGEWRRSRLFADEAALQRCGAQVGRNDFLARNLERQVEADQAEGAVDV